MVCVVLQLLFLLLLLLFWLLLLHRLLRLLLLLLPLLLLVVGVGVGVGAAVLVLLLLLLLLLDLLPSKCTMAAGPPRSTAATTTAATRETVEPACWCARSMSALKPALGCSTFLLMSTCCTPFAEWRPMAPPPLPTHLKRRGSLRSCDWRTISW